MIFTPEIPEVGLGDEGETKTEELYTHQVDLI